MADKIIKTLRFDARLIKKAEELAKRDNRSFNNWLEWLMMREVGFDPFAKQLPDNFDEGHPAINPSEEYR